MHSDGAKRGISTPDHAFAQFSADRVGAVLFGHSHIPYCKRRDGIVVFNPGSPTDKRFNPRYSYGILRIDGARIDARLKYYLSKTAV